MKHGAQGAQGGRGRPALSAAMLVFAQRRALSVKEIGRMARPKKETAEKLTEPVSFRLAKSDYATFVAKVQASGMKESAFLRDCVLGNKTQIVAKPKANVDVTRLLYLSNKVSNNVNQLAHRVNTDHLAGKINDATYERLLFELQAIAQYMKATLKNAD